MRNLLLWIASIALIAFQVPYANATTFYTGATCLSYCGLNLTLDTTYEGGGEYLVTSITATVPVTVLAPGSVENPLPSAVVGFPVYNDNILYYPAVLFPGYSVPAPWDYQGISFAIGGTDWNIACYPASYNCGITNLSVPAFQSFTSGFINETPLPAALPLLATGIGAMGLLGWRRKRKNAATIAVA